MACTTVLVGKKASYNGATMIARNDDCASGEFTVKNYNVVLPDAQPRVYHSVISHLEIPLPENPMVYTAMPNSDPSEKGVWAAAGINAANTAMTATETITSNVRVLAADPYVEYVPAENGQKGHPGGIGEEDIVMLVLPYIHSAREGVQRLGNLLETYGTYEPNGIAFSDHDEVWYMETIGGHHWIARKLPDDSYAVIANQFSLDAFDLDDALSEQKNYMCSSDLREFVEDHYLNLSTGGSFNARLAFGSHSEIDHIYNTPRVWYGQQYFNPSEMRWHAEEADDSPIGDEMPWCRKPEYKITVEDVKFVLSSVYQDTPYDPYEHPEAIGLYRPIGINRTSCTALLEIRNHKDPRYAAVEWIGFGCNTYNAFVPQYAQIRQVPAYFSNASETVSTDNFYWANRLIAALCDPHHNTSVSLIQRYQEAVGARSRARMENLEKELSAMQSEKDITDRLEKVNMEIAEIAKEETQKYLAEVLYNASMGMKNGFSLSDH